ncbi:MAG: hypothetical protein JHC95_12040 [Solirubrobacteraceae bacterium]|nr:hypothetical protein [Solirubrobacteraceae bacterium]
MRMWPSFVVLLAAATLAACGGDDAPPVAEPLPPEKPLTGAQAKAEAPATAGALTRIDDVGAARERLAFVNLAAAAETELPMQRGVLLSAVLGPGARRIDDRASDGTVVQLARAATVINGAEGARVFTDDAALRARLADARPETSAITPSAQSAVQSCLGDTVAQTVLGPATMGDDAALGVGLAESGDRPAGLQLRICAAPKFIRHVHGTERTLERRFGDLGSGETAARIREQEIGEREIVEGVLPANELAPAQLVALLRGGAALRALAWN